MCEHEAAAKSVFLRSSPATVAAAAGVCESQRGSRFNLLQELLSGAQSLVRRLMPLISSEESEECERKESDASTRGNCRRSCLMLLLMYLSTCSSVVR